MAIERKETLYTISIDATSIQEIVYTLITNNKIDKAYELLTNTYCTPGMATQIIQNTLIEAARAKMIADAANNQPELTKQPEIEQAIEESATYPVAIQIEEPESTQG